MAVINGGNGGNGRKVDIAFWAFALTAIVHLAYSFFWAGSQGTRLTEHISATGHLPSLERLRVLERTTDVLKDNIATIREDQKDILILLEQIQRTKG